MTEENGWLVQASVKFGPHDDKNVPVNLANFRGTTAQDVADQISDAIDKRIAALCNDFAAVATIQGQFPQTVPVAQQPQEQYAQQPQTNGRLCDAHRLPRVYKSGTKNGKGWAGWFCSADKNQNPCAVEWTQ